VPTAPRPVAVARWKVSGWEVAVRARCVVCGAVRVLQLPDPATLAAAPSYRRAQAEAYAAHQLGAATVPHHAAALGRLAAAVAWAVCERAATGELDGARPDPSPFALEVVDVVTAVQLMVDGSTMVVVLRVNPRAGDVAQRLTRAAHEHGARELGDVEGAIAAVRAAGLWQPVGRPDGAT